ncbi:SDR family oxidoreductase [Escherichia coli]|uniref:SDR family oxidoreductase n=1 Tax=Escherichia coli TaxID=562 RepID=UPI0020912B8D|nr:SDR family oxidoreductase [Escherichia coli]MCO4902617.1 SDR family oxidoreductase [Escherichia coli]
MKTEWVLVTGGSRGIGQDIVKTLSYSMNVVFTGRDVNAVKETERTLFFTDNRTFVKGYVCNGCSHNDVTTLSSELISNYGPPVGIVHNAGITRDSLHINQDMKDWYDVFHNNIFSIISWHKKLLPAMIQEGRGSIVLLSSVSAIKGNTGQTLYSSNKSALHGFSRSLAHEIGRFGLRVNCVLPGLINTDMLKKIPEWKVKKMKFSIPLGHIGEPSDISHAVEFLLSDKSSYITGQTLVIDGGLTA